jgi:hypothetical protein
LFTEDVNCALLRARIQEKGKGEFYFKEKLFQKLKIKFKRTSLVNEPGAECFLTTGFLTHSNTQQTPNIRRMEAGRQGCKESQIKNHLVKLTFKH